MRIPARVVEVELLLWFLGFNFGLGAQEAVFGVGRSMV